MGEQGEQPISQLDPSVWVDRHGDVLYGYALARLRDPEAAEEVVQETFVSALGAVAQYSGKGAEGAWLLGILKRKIVDHVRRRSRFDAAVGGEGEADPSEAFLTAKAIGAAMRPYARCCPRRLWSERSSGTFSARVWRGCRDGRRMCSPCGKSMAWPARKFVRDWGFPRRIYGCCCTGRGSG